MSRRVTTSRSWGTSSDRSTRVQWVPGSYAAGVYEVWLRGELIAVVTDRWMAELLMAEVAK